MKSKKKVLSKPMIIFLVIISIILFVIWLFLHAPNLSKATVSKNTIDNGYNNRVTNHVDSLVQKDNKLYYKYTGNSGFNCGVYEISSLGSKRILVDTNIGSITEALFYPEADDFFEYDDKIIIKPKYGNRDSLYTINSFFCTKSWYRDLKPIDGNEVYNVDVYNNELYCFAEKSVYKYSNGKYEKKAEFPQDLKGDRNFIEAGQDYYFYSDKIYFPLKNGETYDIYSVSLSDNKCVKICSTPIKADIYNFVIEGNYALIGVWTIPSPTDDYEEVNLYRVNLNSAKTEVLMNDACSFNCFNNKLYVYGDGLYIVDIESKATEKIYNGDVGAAFIFDEDWIYFTDNYNCLYRISINNKEVETIVPMSSLQENVLRKYNAL